MFTINSDQLKTLREQYTYRFISKLSLHYADIFPEHTYMLDQTDINSMVYWAIESGISLKYDVQRLGEILITQGLPLHTKPDVGWVAEILNKPLPSGVNRIDLLREEEMLRDAGLDGVDR